MVKCKGCSGEIEHVPVEDVRGTPQYANAGPALKHVPELPCKWFTETRAADIIAYVDVAAFKSRSVT